LAEIWGIWRTHIHDEEIREILQQAEALRVITGRFGERRDF
jgi:hypothetical protein